MTDQTEKLKALALAAEQDGHHVYINPRDSNKWRENEGFHMGVTPAAVLELIAEVERLRADLQTAVQEAWAANAALSALRAEKEAPDSSHVIPPTRGTGSQQDAGASILDALRNGIPLREPVNITKAVLARREARVSLSGGTGPVACAMLVNIQLTGWAEGPEKAEAFASGYNTAMKWYRDALLDLAERVSADAATRCRAEGGNTSENASAGLASKGAETRMDTGFCAGAGSAPAAGTDKKPT